MEGRDLFHKICNVPVLMHASHAGNCIEGTRHRRMATHWAIKGGASAGDVGQWCSPWHKGFGPRRSAQGLGGRALSRFNGGRRVGSASRPCRRSGRSCARDAPHGRPGRRWARRLVRVPGSTGRHSPWRFLVCFPSGQPISPPICRPLAQRIFPAERMGGRTLVRGGSGGLSR